MGYYFVIGSCISCHRMFSFNPHKVPSIVVNGRREPICKTCIEIANPLRIAKGLPPIPVLPGAYEIVEEGEL